MTWFLCAGRKILGFNVWIEIDLVLSVVIENDLVFVCGPKIIWGSNDLVLCGWSKLTYFCVRAENHLVLVWSSKLTVCVWVVEIDLISVWRVEVYLISAWGIAVD